MNWQEHIKKTPFDILSKVIVNHLLYNGYTNNSSLVVAGAGAAGAAALAGAVDIVHNTWILPTVEFHTLLLQ